jgi:hypothetical protein
MDCVEKSDGERKKKNAGEAQLHILPCHYYL